MAGLRSADVLPKATLEGNFTNTPVGEMARKIANNCSEATWEKMAKEVRDSKPIGQEEISKKIEQIGVERDVNTQVKARTPEEQARYGRAEASASLNKKYLDVGFDGLNAIEKQTLANAVANQMKQDPALAPEFNSWPRVDQANRVIDLLRNNNEYKAFLKDKFRSALDPDKKMLDIQEMDQKRDDIEEKGYKRTEAENSVNDLNAKIVNIDRELRNFERGPAGNAIGVKAIELENLRSGMITLRVELQTHEGASENAKADLQDLANEKLLTLRHGATNGRRSAAEIDTDILNKKTEVRNEQQEVDVRRRSIKRMEDLSLEEMKLRDEKVQTEKDRVDKVISFRKADLDYLKSRRGLDDLTRVRAGQEQDLVDQLRNTFADATDAYFSEKKRIVSEKFDEENKKYVTEISNQDKEALSAALRDWRKEIKYRWNGNIETKYSRNGTLDDWGEFMMPGGVENKIVQMMSTQINKTTGHPYAEAEVRALLVDRSEGGFYKAVSSTVGTELLRRKIMINGVSKADVVNIQNSDWGEGVMEAAISKNKAARELIEKATGEKAINSGFLGKMWEEFKKRPWLLATVLGLAFLPLLAAKDNISGVME